MNKRHYEHTLPNIRGSLSNTYDQDLREELWRRMLPSSWLPADADKMIRMAATYELSGGSISNVIRRCALRLLKQDTPRLDSDILSMAIRRELNKEGRW